MPTANFAYHGLVNSSAQTWQLSKIIDFSRPALILASSNQEAEEIFADLGFFHNEQNLTLFNNWEVLAYEKASPHLQTSAKRISELVKLSQSAKVCITTARACLQKIVPAANYLENSLRLISKHHYTLTELITSLERIGYQSTAQVSSIGQYSWKGKVLDLFCNNEILPLRLEFDQNKLLRIVYFESETQRTIAKEKQKLEILPVREVDFSITPQTIRTYLQEQTLPIRNKLELEKNLETKPYGFPGVENLSTLLSTRLTSLLQIFQRQYPNFQIFILEPEKVELEYQKFYQQLTKRFEKLKAKWPIAEPANCYGSYAQLANQYPAICKLSNQQLESTSTNITTSNNQEIINLQHVTYRSGQHPINPLLVSLDRQKYQINIVAETEVRRSRINSLLIPELQKNIKLIAGKLNHGFKVPAQKLLYISESDLFPIISKRSKTSPVGVSLKNVLNTLSSLSVGDFIIHEDYGRGIYQGLKKMTVAGSSGDFLQLKYADSTLYLPVQKIGRLQKYISSNEHEPELDKLSSNKWPTIKSKVRKSIQELAGELLKLYALREQTPGFKCAPRNNLDQEFADYFPYNETNDQLEAIEATLEDLSSGQVMERLICGDVGFGKTEVALRAAFKVASEGLQVAILAPTTLLVDQHLKNFQERFQAFPIKVAAISRFYSAKQKQQTLAELSAGKIDVIIGTHALLRNKNIFKNLGLLIIDEEQRFGVKQKERIKQMQHNIHVLSMSATPIPRTLYMSLIGVRKISTITTPPAERLAVKTYLMNQSDDAVEDAIWKELQRNGQVYYLHNQIKDLNLVVERLQQLVPSAKLIAAHGQMPEHQLERIMKDFIDKKYDVLVTTTIIENGIDLPNANTILIDRADKFGLSQLYQLRGRVGRSNRQAYTYLFVPNLKKITADARERLQAMESINDLGQGFQLAMRDLEIRGAGNLLGKEQSGNITLIGFELYSKILQEAIYNLQGQDTVELIEPEIKLTFDAYIPDYYLQDHTERIVMYQKLASQNSVEQLDILFEEIEDRYGQAPTEVISYLQMMKLRLLLKSLGITELSFRNEQLHFKIADQHALDSDKILQTCLLKPKKYTLSPRGIISIRYESNFSKDLATLSEFISQQFLPWKK